MLKRINRKHMWTESPGGAMLVWSAAAIAALVISHAGAVACAVTLAAGLAVVLLGRQQSVAALVPIAVGALAGPLVLPWAIAATAVASRLRRHDAPARLDGDLQRELMRCRRRDEPG